MFNLVFLPSFLRRIFLIDFWKGQRKKKKKFRMEEIPTTPSKLQPNSSSKTLTELCRFLPRILLHELVDVKSVEMLDRRMSTFEQTSKERHAALLETDISGFTALNESFAQRGVMGIEILTSFGMKNNNL